MLGDPGRNPNEPEEVEPDTNLINVPTFDRDQNVLIFSVDVLKALKH